MILFNPRASILIALFLNAFLPGFSQHFPLADSIRKYVRSEEYGKAQKHGLQWMDQLQKAGKTSGLEYDAALLFNARTWPWEKTQAVDSVYQLLIPRFEKYPGADSLLGINYAYLGNLRSRNDKPNAEETLLKGISLLTRSCSPRSMDLFDAYKYLAYYFHNIKGDRKAAEETYRKLISMAIQRKGVSSALVATSYSDLAWFFSKWFQSDSAEKYYLKAYAIRKQLFGENGKGMASSYRNLANFYAGVGNYAKADSLYHKALEIYTTAYGEKSKWTARFYYTLGYFYAIDMGELGKGEKAYLKSIELYEPLPSADQDLMYSAMHNLVNVYMDLGEFKKAERQLQKNREILKVYPNSTLGMSYAQLGSLYYRQDKLKEAIACYQEKQKIYTQFYGENHQYTMEALISIANCHTKAGRFYRADSLLKFVDANLRIPANQDTTDHFARQIYWNTIEFLNERNGRYEDALTQTEKEYLKVKQKLGSTHFNLSSTINDLAALSQAMGKFGQAEKWFLQSVGLVNKKIEHNFPYLSDNQKASFFHTIEPTLADFTSFCVSRHRESPALKGHLYNNRLSTKALLLNSSAKWKQHIKASHDKKLFAQYTRWEEYQNQLVSLEQSTDSVAHLRIDSLRAKAEKLEKELSLRSTHFASLADKRQYTWKDVQAKLKPGEAAIEMVRLRKYGIEKTVTDSSDPARKVYRIKGLTDTIQYAALIVKPGLTYPDLVLLENGNEMEGRSEDFYRNCLQKQLKDEQSYRTYWSKINQKLGQETKTIFISPDGVYHSINLQTLFNTETKKYLLEERDIRMVTTTKDLVVPHPHEELNQLAYLVGFPNYNKAPEREGSLAHHKTRSPKQNYFLDPATFSPFNELPGTQKEVEQISGLLTTKGWEVQTLTGNRALEESLKESYKPRVLHIATHGYFQPDTTEGSNPLIRSGLLLTGANRSLAGENSEELEDGILTAYEAMNLNLDNTDLVVLSACETGLGEIKNGEGVYGLQRAFKVAGARSIIMSLWKVDDEATQELMVRFYKNWLGGKTKRTAFLEAQKELKTKYPNPYYWGAFVMVGE